MNSHVSPTALKNRAASTLLGPVRRLSGQDSWMAALRVDQSDPFFFDHALDHVPGMLILCGMVAVVRECNGTAHDGRVAGALTFRRMCELEPAPLLLLESNHTGRGQV